VDRFIDEWHVHAGNMGKDEAKMSSKEKRQQKAREKGGAVAKKDKEVVFDEAADVSAMF